MFQLCAVLTLLMAVFTTRTCGQATSPSNTVDVAGVSLHVGLFPEKREVMLGEPVCVLFRVDNISDRELQIVQGGDYRNQLGRPERYRFTIVDENGQVLPIRDAGPGHGGLVGFQRIPAGKEWHQKLWLHQWARFPRPGTYTVTCRTALQIGPVTHEFPARLHPSAAGIPVEAAARIRVVPADTAKMGLLIESLGREMLGKPSEAAEEARLRLKTIEDERVVPFFVQAAGSTRYDLKFTAMRALANYRSDKALAGIRKGMTAQPGDFDPASFAREQLRQSSADNIRLAAAHALSRSPHPGAASLLFTMRNDPASGVRITVLHALGKMTTEEVLGMIREMTQDTDKVTRDEALRYLRLRTQEATTSRPESSTTQ